MRFFLLALLTMGTLAGYAQTTTTLIVSEKAVAQLEKMRKQTQASVVISKHDGTLPAEIRPVFNKILLQSASEFLAITARNPTKEAYLQTLAVGLASLTLLMPQLEDRQQVAEYYQDLLDIVGLESSEGRLTAFVEGGHVQP